MSASAKVTDSTPRDRAMSNAAADPIMPAPITSSFICRLRSVTRRLATVKFELGSVNEDLVGGKTLDYPMPNSSADSSGVPQRRQMTAEQSPQVRGSVTS